MFVLLVLVGNRSLYVLSPQAGNPTRVNVPLCLDLTLNWLLNLYDWYVDIKVNNHVTYLPI